jgi:hypothetical protein
MHDAIFNAYTVNRLIMFFAAFSVAAIFFALKQNRGSWVALGVSLLTGTSALFVSRFNWVQSEFPFIALAFLGMGLIQMSGSQTKRWWVTSLGAGACFAGAIYFRTIGIVLVPCVFLASWISNRSLLRWRAWIPALLVIFLTMPWFQYARNAAMVAEVPSDQLLLNDYTTAMFHVDPGDPTSDLVTPVELLQRISENGRALLHDLALSTLWVDNEIFAWLLSATLIMGWIRTFRSHPSILEWFALFYTVVLLTYFTYKMRLSAPLIPLVYLYLYAAVSGLGAWVSRHLNIAKLSGFLCATLLLLLMALNLVRMPQELGATKVTWMGVPAKLRWEDMYNAAAWIRNNTPPDAVILCHDAPVISLLAGRRAYTYRYPRKVDLLTKYEPDFVLFDFRSPHTWELERAVDSRSTGRWVLPSRPSWREIRVYEVAKP